MRASIRKRRSDERSWVAIVSALCLQTWGGCAEVPNDQVDNAERNAIIGGDQFDGLPAVGALVLSGGMHCTGTVIAPRLVLTAAHCVEGNIARDMLFVVGRSLSDYDAVLRVASMEAHPAWNSRAIRNDIALIHLAQDAPVEPMAINGSMEGSWVGRRLFSVGFGTTNGWSDVGTGVKRSVWLTIAAVGASQIALEGGSDHNVCSGDSGGPAFAVDAEGNYTIAGLTSYGQWGCGGSTVHTRVDAFLDFIGLEAPAADASSLPCGGETYEGRCDGDQLYWCEDNSARNVDCASRSRSCGWKATANLYDCL